MKSDLSSNCASKKKQFNATNPWSGDWQLTDLSFAWGNPRFFIPKCDLRILSCFKAKLLRVNTLLKSVRDRSFTVHRITPKLTNVSFVPTLASLLVPQVLYVSFKGCHPDYRHIDVSNLSFPTFPAPFHSKSRILVWQKKTCQRHHNKTSLTTTLQRTTTRNYDEEALAKEKDLVTLCPHPWQLPLLDLYHPLRAITWGVWGNTPECSCKGGSRTQIPQLDCGNINTSLASSPDVFGSEASNNSRAWFRTRHPGVSDCASDSFGCMHPGHLALSTQEASTITLRTRMSWNRTTSRDRNYFTNRCVTCPVSCLSIIPLWALASVHNEGGLDLHGVGDQVIQTSQLAWGPLLWHSTLLQHSTTRRWTACWTIASRQCPVSDESATGRSPSVCISDSAGDKSRHHQVILEVAHASLENMHDSISRLWHVLGHDLRKCR